MQARLRLLRETVVSSFWFVPAAMASGAVGMALLMSQIDSRYGRQITEAVPWIETTVEASRAGMASIAGAMATVAGVIFSTTIVMLSIAASQYGSRLIRTFINNRVTHFTLGAFISASLYCLLILTDIRSGKELGFVPHVSSFVGVCLAVVCMGMFIYFLHNTAISIQAPQVVNASAQELRAAIDRLFPEQVGQSGGEAQSAAEIERMIAQHLARLGGELHPILSRREGYIQAIDSGQLMQAAKSREVIVILDRRPGDFVTEGTRLGAIWPADRVEESLERDVRGAVLTGPHRTPHQDPLYAANELVEVAVRAFSPGINDPFTAMNCINRLGAALARLAQRSIPSPLRFDNGGVLRVIARPITFEDFCETAVHQIRHFSQSSAAVTLRLLSALEAAANAARRPSDRAALKLHAEMTCRGAERRVNEPHELAAIRTAYERIVAQVDERDASDEAAPASHVHASPIAAHGR